MSTRRAPQPLLQKSSLADRLVVSTSASPRACNAFGPGDKQHNRRAVVSPRASSVPQPPPKIRPKPQRRWGIGPGKRYPDEAAFTADLDKWNSEHSERELLVKEYERAYHQARDRSGRKCASGASKRAASKAEAQRGAQRRYLSRVKDAATKALARELGLGFSLRR